MRRAVTFRNASGEMLFGILDQPQPARADVGIVLLSPGVKSRVAPHRLYNKLGDRFVRQNLSVLRFDFAGLGDSEGHVPEPLLPDLYRAIQLGRYASDTQTAIEWMRTHAGVERVILGGLCGGAITGLIAAQHSPHVAGLFSVGLPVTLDGSAVDKVATMSEGQLRSVRRKYVAKLVDPRSWARVVSLKTDFRLLWRSLRGARRASAPKTAAPRVLGGNGNPLFPPALFDMLHRKRPVLLAFSGADRLHSEFKELFGDPHATVLEQFADRLDVRVIEQANHVLTFPEWQEAFFAACEQWLDARFPRSSAGVASTPVSEIG
jgi:uncharacterized protein